MASGGVGSDVVYSGTVEHVVKGFGFIRLDGGKPVRRAFFIRSSVGKTDKTGKTVGDLTERFQKGCKIKARIVLTDSRKTKYQARDLVLANQDDSCIRGGDNYLRNYLEYWGTVELRQLVKDLSVAKDNCPRFLKNGDVNEIKKVVALRPDWFEIGNGFLRLKTDEEKPVIVLDRSSVRGGDNYLKKYLEDLGAFQLEQLVQDLKIVKTNCPKFLKNGDVNQIKKIVALRPDMFEIKNGFLCLTAVEEELLDEFLQNLPMHENAIKLESINGMVRPDHRHRRYLHASGSWNNGVKDFVSRNAGELVFWNETIQTLPFLLSKPELKKKFRADLLAVKYYSNFVNRAKSSLTIKSLSGHFNQANSTVKEAAKPNESEFREFLERNSMFFVLRGDNVEKCPAHRLSIIDQFWLKTKPNPLLSSSGVPPKPLPRSISNPAKVASPSKSPDQRSSQPKTPVQISKAFSDLEGELMTGKPATNHPFKSSFLADGVNLQTSTHAIPSLTQTQTLGPTPCDSIFSLPEAEIFKKLVGNPIARALEDEILSNDTLNTLLLLRLNIGKPPMAKFRIPGEASGYNHTLKINPVVSEDLQRILGQNEVMKMDTPSHYGVKGTLHSIRTLEQGGKMTGLTLFCQLHEINDGLGLDIWKGKKLTAVFTGNYPVKYIYNYLRCKCDKLSKRGDILVVDVDGQLSGCDELSHPSVGNVTRVICSSSSELTQAITNSIQHMHEYAAIIGIDDVEHLKAVRKMCSKDTQVIAEISSDLKQEVENLFT